MPSNFLTNDESLEHEQELPNVRFMCGTLGVELPVCVCPFLFRASLSSPYSHFLPNSLNPPSLTPTLHTSYTYYPVTHSFTHSNTNSFLSPPPPLLSTMNGTCSTESQQYTSICMSFVRHILVQLCLHIDVKPRETIVTSSLP